MNLSFFTRLPVGVHVSVLVGLAALVIWPLALREVARVGQVGHEPSGAGVAESTISYVQSPASAERTNALVRQINTAFTTIKATSGSGGKVTLVAAEANDYAAWLAAVGWMSLTSDSKSVVRTKSICVNECSDGFAVAELELIEFRFLTTP